MLTEPDGDGHAVLKPNHAVLPVSNMISQNRPSNGLSQVESIEIHIISIDDSTVKSSTTMIIDNNRT